MYYKYDLGWSLILIIIWLRLITLYAKQRIDTESFQFDSGGDRTREILREKRAP